MAEKKRDIDFGKKASEYDKSWGRVSRRFYRLLLEHVELKPGMTVLDAGCGTGTILREMGDACSINGYGIDLQENMIKEAKRKCPEMNIQVSRCEETPFKDNTFDVVITCMAYHHFADRAGFAQEAARILKAGGCLYIADPRLPKIIRKLINTVSNLSHIAGGFYSPHEIYKDFAAYGFEPGDYVFDGYAQVVGLLRSPKS